MENNILTNVKEQKKAMNRIIKENKNKTLYEIIMTIQQKLGTNINWKELREV